MARGYTLTQTGSEVQEILNDEPTKQDQLVSGENIKTINNQSILGHGNIPVITSETDPTVPAWAKRPSKPSYAAWEVGAVPTTRTVNGKTLSSNISLTASDVGAYTKPDDGIPGSDLAEGVIPDVSDFITKTVDDLTNYYTKTQTYTQSEVNSLIAGINSFEYEVVATLPTASASTMHKIYLVPSSDPQSQNVKDEYITIESSDSYSWEQIGSTAIDLSGYVTTTALNSALADYTTTAELNTLLAGYQTKIDSNHKLDYSLLSNTPTIPDAQIQSDWNQSDNTKKDYIKNKPTIPTALSQLTEDTTHRVVTDTEKTTWSGKQDALVSGTNIKTVNNENLLGSGNITIQSGGTITFRQW